MITRNLYALARQGYQFPAPGVFRNVAEAPRARPFPAVRIRVVRRFHALRRVLEVGEVVNLPEPDATDAVALGRAVEV